MEPPRSVLLGVILSSVVVVSCRTSAVHSGQNTLPHDQGACEVEERNVSRLGMDGERTVYVEPMTLVVADEVALVAGVPVYSWRRTAASVPELEPSDSFAGMLINSRGIQLLPMPAGFKYITHMRAILHESQRFGVLFAQLTEPDHPGRDAEAVAYWYGLTDGKTWQSLEQLPFPPAGILRTYFASDLVRMRDTLMFAVPIVHPSRIDVLVFTRGPEGWSFEEVRTGFAGYVAIAPEESGRHQLAIVRPDTLIRDSNSLSLFIRELASWRDHGFASRGGREPIHEPRITIGAGVRTLTWIASTRESRIARGRRLSQTGALGPVEAFASDVQDIVAVQNPSGPPAWVVTSGSGERQTLQLLEWTGGHPVVRDLVKNPFKGPILAYSRSGQITVLGPLQGKDSSEEPVASAAIQLRARCSGVKD
jgi:hypothetical protein